LSFNVVKNEAGGRTVDAQLGVQIVDLIVACFTSGLVDPGVS
jgi:hypothetical protein